LYSVSFTYERQISFLNEIKSHNRLLRFRPSVAKVTLFGTTSMGLTPIGVGPGHVINGANQRTLGAGNG
jgi:hypothetical protein